VSASDSQSVSSPSFAVFVKIYQKLDDSNFLVWHQEVEPCIELHNYQHFIANPSIPLRFLSETDHKNGKTNPAYTLLGKKMKCS